MTAYVAFLRGVYPATTKMGDLKRAVLEGGFKDVRTVQASGNVVFEGKEAPEGVVERKIERAFRDHLGREYFTIVRSIESLRTLLGSDPFGSFRLKTGSKRVVTFLRERPSLRIDLPVELHGARILTLRGTEAFTAYVRTPKGPVFMTLIEKTFGKNVTTRTWETLERIART